MELELDYPLLARLVAADLRSKPPAKTWLTTLEAADYVGIPAKTLEAYRTQGKGPRFSRVGKHVRYHRSDIDSWLKGLSDA